MNVAGGVGWSAASDYTWRCRNVIEEVAFSIEERNDGVCGAETVIDGSNHGDRGSESVSGHGGVGCEVK